MPDHAFELSFDAATDAALQAQWEALRLAGLPSQAEHRSMVNAPHLTLVAASPIDPALVKVALDLVAPLLPLTQRIGGLVLLGTGPRVTLAHLVEPGAELAAVVEQLRARVPTLRHPLWMPHITLARRVPRRRLPEALDALASVPSPTTVRATRLRWWDPEAGTVEDLVPGR